jgi:GTP-binding protein
MRQIFIQQDESIYCAINRRSTAEFRIMIDDDELVEITPKHIRIRKKLLKETNRRRAERMNDNSD